MADIDKVDTPISAPGTSFSERGEGRVARRDHGRAAEPNFLGRIAKFLRDVRAEMKRVSWPDANTVKNTTIITLIAVVFFAVYLFVVDLGMTYLVKGIDWVMAKLFALLGVG